VKVFAVGDVIGKPGRELLRARLPSVIAAHRVDVVVANAENSAGGLGTTTETAEDFLSMGVHVLTGGNHTWKHRELTPTLERDARVLRPYNYPDAPGRGAGVFELADGRAFAVVNLIGRTFMEPVENPFAAVDRALAEVTARTRVVLVDLHAEATSEKRAMGWHLDGRVSAVWGTHTHVPTADEEILPRGTAYVTDLGMTGPYASVIGLEPATSVKRFRTNRPGPYRVAEGNLQVRGVVIDVDEATGRARSIERIVERG